MFKIIWTKSSQRGGKSPLSEDSHCVEEVHLFRGQMQITHNANHMALDVRIAESKAKVRVTNTVSLLIRGCHGQALLRSLDYNVWPLNNMGSPGCTHISYIIYICSSYRFVSISCSGGALDMQRSSLALVIINRHRYFYRI
jgi:hypothetical protein